MILTVDLGTSATKARVWSDTGPVAHARADLTTSHPAPGWAEQDPEDWWTSLASAVASLGPAHRERVTAIAFSAARETFVPVDADGCPLGNGIVWSDRRAAHEAADLAQAAGGVEAFRQRSGVILDAGSPLAKIEWLARHQPERLERARWIMAPRDLVVLRLTGEAVTDVTMAGRGGLLDARGSGARLVPRVLAPTDVAGKLDETVAAALGLTPAIPVVIGAGDRACEAVGSRATRRDPVVSWGTTANLSAPVADRPEPIPAGATVSPGALGGFLLEYGLSAAGQCLEWLAGIAATSVSELATLAAHSPPGAGGILAVPWLNGARAPWWQPGAAGAFLNLRAGHTTEDMARALVEGVAFEVARSAETLGGVDGVIVVGGGAARDLWPSVLAGVLGVPVRRRRPEAASVGAYLVAAAAMEMPVDSTAVNPDIGTAAPDPELVGHYREMRARSDQAARAALDLAETTWT